LEVVFISPFEDKMLSMFGFFFSLEDRHSFWPMWYFQLFKEYGMTIVVPNLQGK
jgi:hypothetical protein